MRMTTSVKKILAATLQQAEAIRDHHVSQLGPNVDRVAIGRAWEERRMLTRIGVAWDYQAIMGRTPSPSDSASISRTLKLMEEAGLIVRSSRWGTSRTTHIKLTPEGERIARELAADYAHHLEAATERAKARQAVIQTEYDIPAMPTGTTTPK